MTGSAHCVIVTASGPRGSREWEGIVNVDRKALKAALLAAKRATSSRPGIPALTGVKITATAHGFELVTTDLEAAYVGHVEATGFGGSWTRLVGRAVLADAIASGPDRIEVDAAGAGGLTVGSATFRGLPVDDFPNLPEPGPVCAVVDAQELRAALAIVEPAASGDYARPIITGVLFEVGDAQGSGTIGLTATDSYRLHHAEVTGATDVGSLGFAPVIPARVLAALGKMIGAKTSGTVTIDRESNGSSVGFTLPDGSRIASRVIEGQFPNYRQLIPDADAAGTVTATYGPALVDVLTRAATMARDTTPVRFDFAAGRIEVSASSPDLGTFAETIDAPEVAEAVTVAFSPVYLGTALAAFGSGTFAVRDGLKPGMVRPLDGPAFALVMPVRLPAPVAEAVA